MVKIVTDSTADIPPQIGQDLGINIVPLQVRFGTEVYRDGVDLTTRDFYRKLISSNKLPTTASPSSVEVAQLFDKLTEETDEIVSIHLSSKFSVLYEVALRAKEQMKKQCRVEVIDSQSGIMGLGLIVIAAAREAENGASFEQVVEIVRQAIPKSHVRMCFDTLEYLRKGGRIGRARALLGSILKVNPILGIKDGEAYPFGRERSWSKAVDNLYNFANSFDNVRGLAVEYATTPNEAEALAQRLSPISPNHNVYMSMVSPVVGTHVGPHVLAVSVLEG
jgi:DegV family protein with EDD domain